MKYIGNITLELESFAGKVLKYIQYPQDLCILVQCLCSLPDISEDIVDELVTDIKNKIITKQKRLNLSTLFKFYRGEEIELAEALYIVVNQLEVILPIIESLKIAENEMFVIQSFNALRNLKDYGYLGKLMTFLPKEPQSVIDLQIKQAELQIYLKNAKACLSLYGRGYDRPIPQKQWKFDTYENIMKSCYQLQQQLAQSKYPVKLISIVLGITQELSMLAEQMKLDPLYKDIAEELYLLATNPESYENACKKREVCEKVGSLFSQLYKEHVIEAGIELLSHFDKDSEDEKLCIEQGLGINRDLGILTTLCSQYVNKNYKQGQ